MDTTQIIVSALILLSIVIFTWDKISPDVVGIGLVLVLFALPLDNGRPILSWQAGDALSSTTVVDKATVKVARESTLGTVFANEAILVVIFMFIVGAAIEQTGLVDVLGRWYTKIAGTSHKSMLLGLALIAIPFSAIMNNTTVVVVLLPMVLASCRKRELAPSRYLIPLSYFAIAGGMLTVIGTSTNLISNNILKDRLGPGNEFRMFEFFWVGASIALGCVAYVYFFGRKVLPERVSLAAMIDSDDSREFLTAAIVSENSPLVGKTLPATALAKMRNLRIIEIRRSGNRVDLPLNEVVFEPGDRVILKSSITNLVGLNSLEGIQMAAKSELGLSYVQTEKAVIMEGMVGPRSRFLGKSLKELNFRQEFGVIILAIHRDGTNMREHFESGRLEFGDTLLLEGSTERMKDLFKQRDLVNLSAPKNNATATNRAWVALLALLFIIVTGALEGVGIKYMEFTWVALTAAFIVVAGGCIRPAEIYSSVEWRIIVMMLGTFALGAAMSKTGTDQAIIDQLRPLLPTNHPHLMISGVLLFSIIMTELLSNNAVATIFTPIAITLAQSFSYDPKPFALAVMLGASIGFAIPAGYQTHMMVYGAGGYKFSDFVKAGIPLDIVCWIIGSLTIPFFFPV